MSDSEWARNVRPKFAKLVGLLEQLDASIFDKLFSEELLTTTQYEKILSERKSPEYSDSDIIRKVLVGLMKKPHPSFRQFCKVLEEIDKGDAVLRLLIKF